MSKVGIAFLDFVASPNIVFENYKHSRIFVYLLGLQKWEIPFSWSQTTRNRNKEDAEIKAM